MNDAIDFLEECLTREMTDLSIGQRSSGTKHFHKVRAVEQALFF